MSSRKVCLVISPIGDEGSEFKQEADALVWLIETALAKYDFEVLRIDEIAKPTSTTRDFVEPIQQAQLVAIVLTRSNPIVYYEAGRRHETGRPFIHLAKRGEPIPFFAHTTRTILYDDLESRTDAARVIEEIRRFVDELEKDGFGHPWPQPSISGIAQSLDRIERTLDEIKVRTSSLVTIDDGPIQAHLLSPNELRLDLALPALLPIADFVENFNGLLKPLSFIYSVLSFVFLADSYHVERLDSLLREGIAEDTKQLSDQLANFVEVNTMPLQVASMHYGSPGSMDLLGIGKVLEVIRDIVKDAVWRGRHERELAKTDLKKAEYEATKSEIEIESQKTGVEKAQLENEKMRLELIGQKLDLLQKAGELGLSDDARAALLSVLAPHTQAISDQSNRMLDQQATQSLPAGSTSK
jgi:hypothetical protein